MKELSLHILDIVQNSIQAKASHIEIFIEEDLSINRLRISIKDDGIGMDQDTLQKVIDPFFTSRTTRKVGLGIPFFKEAAESCGGFFVIKSELNQGTYIEAVFQHNHIDRVPIGKIHDTIMVILHSDQQFDLTYRHRYNQKEFKLDTIEIKSILETEDLRSPDILIWIKEYIHENINELKES